MNFAYVLKHLIGLLVFSLILFFTVLIENVEKFPSIAAKLPYRFFIVAKEPVKLYECESFSERKLIKVLETGETADDEAIVCGGDAGRIVRLSDGRKACISSGDDDKIEAKRHRFYYF